MQGIGMFVANDHGAGDDLDDAAGNKLHSHANMIWQDVLGFLNSILDDLHPQDFGF